MASFTRPRLRWSAPVMPTWNPVPPTCPWHPPKQKSWKIYWLSVDNIRAGRCWYRVSYVILSSCCCVSAELVGRDRCVLHWAPRPPWPSLNLCGRSRAHRRCQYSTGARDGSSHGRVSRADRRLRPVSTGLVRDTRRWWYTLDVVYTGPIYRRRPSTQWMSACRITVCYFGRRRYCVHHRSTPRLHVEPGDRSTSTSSRPISRRLHYVTTRSIKSWMHGDSLVQLYDATITLQLLDRQVSKWNQNLPPPTVQWVVWWWLPAG